MKEILEKAVTLSAKFSDCKYTTETMHCDKIYRHEMNANVIMRRKSKVWDLI